MSKPLQPLTVAAPGFLGLNTENSGSILPPGWATLMTNLVIDEVGRIASRKGTKQLNAAAIASSPTIGAVHEYIDASGNKVNILAADNKIWKEVSGTITDVSGTITTPTGDDWQFVNFNSWCIGFQDGHDPIVSTSATTPAFADSGGTQYQGVAGLSAYGRLWTVTANTLYYSDLLINNFTGGSSGSFDLAKFWPNGMDEAIAIADFNGLLIVFGKNSIIIYENADDITNMAIVEGIDGIGCLARDSLQVIGQDLVFLSDSGIRSLSRTLQTGQMPLTDISQHVRSAMMTSVVSETPIKIKSVYDHLSGYYLLSLPTAGISYYFSVKFPNEDGTWKAAKWDYAPTAMMNSEANILYVARTAGFLSYVTGWKDEANSTGADGVSYTIDYEGVWNDLGDQEGVAPLLKIPKSVSVLASGTASAAVLFKWAVDYEDTFSNVALTFSTNEPARFGIATHGVSVFSSVGKFSRVRGQLGRSGQVIKSGLTTTINGSSFALQRFDLLVKLGRIGV